MKSSRSAVLDVLFWLFCIVSLEAQSTVRQLTPILEAQILGSGLVRHVLEGYLSERLPQLPTVPDLPGDWTSQVKRIREKLLREVVYSGWPVDWVEAPLRFREVGAIQKAEGYLMRKLLLEVLPGLEIPGLLYEPLGEGGGLPAVLNLNGHVGIRGKAIEYKQKRCISLARRGFVALNLEWLGYGELTHSENSHWFGAHLDLVGANSLGLFYLAMRKGLDALDQHPRVDRRRLAVTGLSGGGWQTIILSSLDERVRVAIPVAGYSALISRLERSGDTGDIEQNATDLLQGQDYTTLTAMRAPRPTLLIYNAKDDCCFRAPLVKPYIFDQVKSFFHLFGKGDHLGWHENKDPATHNYQLDNRLQAYRFLVQHFNLETWNQETPVGREVKNYEELVVGLPEENLTILGVARQLAASASRKLVPKESVRSQRNERRRQRLRSVLRYREVDVIHNWAIHNTRNRGVETVSYRFEFSDGLVAAALWGKGIATVEGAPASIVLLDEGMSSAGIHVSNGINRGEQILAVDLILTAEAEPRDNSGKSEAARYSQLLAAIGERPLGIRASHLLALGRWLKSYRQAARVRIDSRGRRSQVVALLSAALQPQFFSEVCVEDGMGNLETLLEIPVTYQEAPELFCLGLFPDFDLDHLLTLAQPTQVKQ